MTKKMKGLMLALALSTGACAYGGVAVTADGHAVIPRNDGILFGLMRAVYVCNVTPTGLSGCVAGQAP